MKGKIKPTVKLDSQCTLPPTMKADGREDCRKISVMSSAGMGPGGGAGWERRNSCPLWKRLSPRRVPEPLPYRGARGIRPKGHCVSGTPGLVEKQSEKARMGHYR